MNFAGHGGREKQRLPVRRQQFADFFNIRDEAHIEHAVGLVDHQNLYAVQHQFAAPEMIQQPARCGDQNIDATVNQFRLVVKGYAANQQGHTKLVIFPIDFKILTDLHGQFPCGFKNQRARHARLGAPLCQQINHRKREAGGFAGAGLRDTQNVPAA